MFLRASLILAQFSKVVVYAVLRRVSFKETKYQIRDGEHLIIT